MAVKRLPQALMATATIIAAGAATLWGSSRMLGAVGAAIMKRLRGGKRGRVVNVSNQGLSSLPKHLTDSDHRPLAELNASRNRLCAFPALPPSFQALISLNLSGNELAELPAAIGILTALRDLDLGRNHLHTVPPQLGDLTELLTLNLMCNKLSSLPPEIGQLRRLQRLGLKSNCLEELPPEIGGLESLQELFLSDNRLRFLPAEFGQMRSLVKLQLSWNQLEALPAEMARLPNLELVRVAVNRIVAVPPEWASLPRLAWFSLAGNPASTRPAATRPLGSIQPVDFSQLKASRTLGEGASGDVFLSEFCGEKVAVKVFKSEVSPDGQASDEIAITECLDHPQLARVIGESGEPRALILRYIDGAPLAEKPNLQSLLRCRWKPREKFSRQWVLAVASKVSAALSYMHSKGICHGDVYAHNILANADGNAVLCDYGASFFYDSDCPRGRGGWEGMEVRAFGLFLKDLVDRVSPGKDRAAPGGADPRQLSLRGVQEMCLRPELASRPGFKDLERMFVGMMGC